MGYANIRLSPDDLLIYSPTRSTSYNLPLAISHLLNIRVAEANAELEQAGESRTTRNEMVAMLVALACRDDVYDLKPYERILRYRSMTVGELLPELVEPSTSGD